MGECRNKLLEQLKPFARQIGSNAGQSSRFTAGSRDADYEAVEWIASYHHDGNCGGCFLGRPKPLIAPNEHYVDIEMGKFAREFGQTIKITLRPSGLNGDVFPFDIPQFAETLSESLIDRRRRGCVLDPADARQFVRPLGVGPKQQPIVG